MSDRTYVKGFNDKNRAKQKKRVKDLIEKWVKPIGLGWWTIHFHWHDTIVAPDTDNTPSSVAMDCFADWKYMEATINVNLDQVENLDDQTLEYCFVHELMHIFLAEMREDGIEHEERVATTLAKAMLWAVEHVGAEHDKA